MTAMANPPVVDRGATEEELGGSNENQVLDVNHTPGGIAPASHNDVDSTLSGGTKPTLHVVKPEDDPNQALARASAAWMVDLDRDDKGQYHKSYRNFALIFANDEILSGLGVNEMGDELAWRVLPPWKAKRHNAIRQLDDSDQARIDERLRSYFGAMLTSLPKNLCQEATIRGAAERPFSPWRDHLDALPAWDGVGRLASAIPDECVDRSPYTERVFTNFFLGMMQRVYEPGCQMDSMLVFVGGQGLRKTSFFRSIVPSADMYAELKTIPGDDSGSAKDLLTKAHRAAVAVFDEINKLARKADQEALKAFLTERRDSWRPAYGRHQSQHSRSFVVGGTTNEEEFLLDTTGNRRYWPIRVTAQIPVSALTRSRMDLLLAEARDRYRAGERYDYGDDFEQLAETERQQYLDDPVGDAIATWIELEVAKHEGLVLSGAAREPRFQVTMAVLNRLTVSRLIAEVPELKKVDPVKERFIASKIRDAMDRHPDYRRTPKAVKVGGISTKVAWDRVVPLTVSTVNTPAQTP